MYPMRSLIRSAWVATSKPTTVALPPVGSRIPQSMRMVVDLPAPFGPSTPKISPRSTVSETSRTATRRPKVRDRFSVLTMGSAVIVCSGLRPPRLATHYKARSSRSSARLRGHVPVQSGERWRAGVEQLLRVVDRDADADDQGLPLLRAEEEAGRELGRTTDVLDDSRQQLASRVDPHGRLSADAYAVEVLLGDEHVEVRAVRFAQDYGRGAGRHDLARLGGRVEDGAGHRRVEDEPIEARIGSSESRPSGVVAGLRHAQLLGARSTPLRGQTFLERFPLGAGACRLSVHLVEFRLGHHVLSAKSARAGELLLDVALRGARGAKLRLGGPQVFAAGPFADEIELSAGGLDVLLARVALRALHPVVEDGEHLSGLDPLAAMNDDPRDPPRDLEPELPLVQLDHPLQGARVAVPVAGDEHEPESHELVYHTTDNHASTPRRQAAKGGVSASRSSADPRWATRTRGRARSGARPD